VSAGLPVAACNKYHGIGLVVVKHVCENGKARLYCLQCCLNANKSITIVFTSLLLSYIRLQLFAGKKSNKKQSSSLDL